MAAILNNIFVFKSNTTPFLSPGLNNIKIKIANKIVNRKSKTFFILPFLTTFSFQVLESSQVYHSQ